MLSRAVGSLLLAGAMGCAGGEAPSAHPFPLTEAVTVSHATSGGVRARPGTTGPGYVRGSTDAQIVVVEFSDFGCHYCAEFARTVLPEIEREYIAPGRVRWQLVPLATASTPHALEAAAAAECASQQDQVWTMHDLIFARRREWMRIGNPEASFVSLARELGMDSDRFLACYRDPRTAATVSALRALAHQFGVRAAPTFLINGRRVEGALPLDGFRDVLNAAFPAG